MRRELLARVRRIGCCEGHLVMLVMEWDGTISKRAPARAGGRTAGPIGGASLLARFLGACLRVSTSIVFEENNNRKQRLHRYVKCSINALSHSTLLQFHLP